MTLAEVKEVMLRAVVLGCMGRSDREGSVCAASSHCQVFLVQARSGSGVDFGQLE